MIDTAKAPTGAATLAGAEDIPYLNYTMSRSENQDFWAEPGEREADATCAGAGRTGPVLPGKAMMDETINGFTYDDFDSTTVFEFIENSGSNFQKEVALKRCTARAKRVGFGDKDFLKLYKAYKKDQKKISEAQHYDCTAESFLCSVPFVKDNFDFAPPQISCPVIYCDCRTEDRATLRSDLSADAAGT